MVEKHRVVYVIFRRKISKKTKKITQTNENSVNENYVHGTELFCFIKFAVISSLFYTL